MENNLQSNTNEISENTQTQSQFLTFALNNEVYGVDIMKVMEIKGWQETTPIPDSPGYMKGVIDLRGIVVPIFDLKSRFGLGETEIDSSKVVIVLTLGDKTIGILVDSVSDILSVSNDDIKSNPSAASDSQVESDYINGLISKDDSMIILLGVEKLFDIEVIEKASQ